MSWACDVNWRGYHKSLSLEETFEEDEKKRKSHALKHAGQMTRAHKHMAVAA